MRRTLGLFIALLFTRALFAQGTKQITIDDLFRNNTFSAKNVPGFNAMKDGEHYTQIDMEGGHQCIRMYELETGKPVKTIYTNAIPGGGETKVNIEEYKFSADEQKLMLFVHSEHIYRHSASYHVYVLDISSGALKLVDNDKILHATFSPDGKWVAYVKNNNLYCKELAAETPVQITTDGEKNKIINGNCDWVYEEEFSFTKAFEWSKDGNYIAFYRFDESQVPEYTMTKYTGLYPEQYTYKYPKAGERNSVVQIKIYNVLKRSTLTTNTGDADQYIPRIKWSADPGKLCIYRLNRLQNNLELLLTNASDGAMTTIYSDNNRWYININDEITFLPDGHSMIIRNEKAGYSHLYNWDWQTQKLKDLTEGLFDVDALVGVDLENKLVYYTAAEKSPLERQLYVVTLNGKKERCLTPERGTHAITPCVGYDYFVDKYSEVNKVPVYFLRNSNGKIIRTLEDNSALEAKMKEYAMGDVRFLKIKGTEEMLNAWMITPPGFDSTKKYPVLMYQYSGPGSQEVADRFPLGNYFWHQMLAQKGYIVVCADGTGTGFRGEEFRKKTYLQLGKMESDDQIAAARELGKLRYIDPSRIGIWGWSYGGFMSSTCLMKGNDVFKAAIAVAPVTNWRYYDNIYTERYMRTPQENPEGYDSNAPEKMADKLKGNFLLIHGTGDDNVHFQNSVMLTSALIAADKDFESEYYPDKAHGISGGNTRHQLYKRMTDFILKNL